MTEYNDLFRFLSVNYEKFFDSECCGEFFSDDEECPYGDAAFHYIERSVTIYKSETIQRGIPGDVSSRLHSVIKKRWLLKRGNIDDEGRLE